MEAIRKVAIVLELMRQTRGDLFALAKRQPAGSEERNRIMQLAQLLEEGKRAMTPGFERVTAEYDG